MVPSNGPGVRAAVSDYGAGVEPTEITIVGLVLVAYAAVSRRIERWPVTMPIVFVGIGAFLSATGAVNVIAELGAVGLLAEGTLAVILFSDAVRIDLRRLQSFLAMPARLLLIGLPLTILLGTAVNAVLISGVALAEVALLATILAPTDAALGSAVVEDESVPARERLTLNVESGLNDGLAAPIVAVLMSISIQEGRSAGYWVVYAFEQVGYGTLVGAAAGSGIVVLLRWTRANHWSDGRYEQIATFAVPIIAFTGSAAIGGNGFIAAFVAGLTFGGAHRRGTSGAVASAESLHLGEFTEDAAQLLGVMAFFVFGNLFLGETLGQYGPPEYLAMILSLTLVRMIPVWIAYTGTRLPWRSRLFVGWFGPRGLASIVFAILLLEEAADMESNTDQIVGVITLTVTASVLLHGISAAPLARRYGAWAARADLADEQRRDMDMPDLPAEHVPRARWSWAWRRPEAAQE